MASRHICTNEIRSDTVCACRLAAELNETETDHFGRRLGLGVHIEESLLIQGPQPQEENRIVLEGRPRRRRPRRELRGVGGVLCSFWLQIMELINSYSKQRGRVIDFKEILYGYWRLDPVHGVDLILDLLLVYRKYRGHKMTVQVRRHAYVQQTFTGKGSEEFFALTPTTNKQ